MLDIKPYETKIKKICANLRLKNLALFGSAITDRFGQESDIDILVEFNLQGNENLFNTYFTLKEQLEELFHRPVDIVMERSVKNPFLKRVIDATKKNIYAG